MKSIFLNGWRACTERVALTFLVCLLSMSGWAQSTASNYLLSDGVGSISGHVQYRDKPPSFHTSVYAFFMSISGGRTVMLQACATQTDDHGDYECESVPSGRFVVIAVPTASSDVATDANISKIAAYYLPWSDFDNANLVSVGSGEHASVNVDIAPERTFALRGKVEGTIAPSEITLFRNSDQGTALRLPMHPHLNHDGSFEFTDVPAGNYTVRALGTVNGKRILAISVLRVPSEKKIEVLHFPTLHTVKLTVQNLDKKTSTIAFVNRDSGDRYETVSDRGVFEITLPQAGYAVNVVGEEGCLVSESVGWQGLTNGVELNQSKDIVELTASYREHCLEIAGTLRSAGEQDVLIADVELKPVKVAHTDNEGNFAVRGMLPGKYYLFAWKNLNAIPYNDEGFLALKRESATKVSLSFEESRPDKVLVDVQPD